MLFFSMTGAWGQTFIYTGTVVNVGFGSSIPKEGTFKLTINLSNNKVFLSIKCENEWDKWDKDYDLQYQILNTTIESLDKQIYLGAKGVKGSFYDGTDWTFDCDIYSEQIVFEHYWQKQARCKHIMKATSGFDYNQLV